MSEIVEDVEREDSNRFSGPAINSGIIGEQHDDHFNGNLNEENYEKDCPGGTADDDDFAPVPVEDK